MSIPLPPVPSSGSHVQIWIPRVGKPRPPRWSVLVAEGSTDEDLAQLVESAVVAFNRVGDRLAAPPTRFTDELAENEREDAELRGEDDDGKDPGRCSAPPGPAPALSA